MSNLFVALFLTTITGTAFCAVGLVFRKLLFKSETKLLRFQMEATQCAFLAPVVHAALYVRTRAGLQTAGAEINLFYSTVAIRRLFAALGCIWVLLFLGLLAHKVYVRFRWIEVFRGNIPEEDGATEAMFREICGKLGIDGKVALYRNDSIEMPCITYADGFAVVLPLERYTRKETAVILYHELCHYLNGDIYLKTAGCIVSLLHVFNPAVHIMLRQLSLVCEECCDRIACEKGEGVFSRKEYFRTILNVLNEDSSRERYNLFMLADTIGDYERRVQCMKEYRKHGGFKRRMVATLAACFLLGSSMTALAAGGGIASAYGRAAESTVAILAEGAENVDITDRAVALSDEEILEEFAQAYDLDPEDVVMMGEDGIETIGNFITLEWKVPAGKTYMTTGFNKEEGSKVSVMTVGDPDDITYWMGIKDPNELMRYVEGTGSMAYEFDITIKGRYYFFVSNRDGSREVTVKGTVIK